MTTKYDFAVIGMGMIGSAALRYLSAANLSVVGIGPVEPKNWKTHTGAFASHYDQARITRITDPDETWGLLGKRSIATYADIERKSGVVFHRTVGQLRISPDVLESGDTLNVADAVGRRLGASFVRLDRAQLARQFPYLNFAPNAEGLHETGGAGYVMPRLLVQAQLTIARQQGAHIVRDEVRAIEGEAGHFVIYTRLGNAFTAKKVLLSMHGWTNFLMQSWLGRGLALESRAATVVLAELDSDELQRIAGIPTLIWRLQRQPVLKSIYSTPPVQYPDGRVCFKIGGTLHQNKLLHTPDQFTTWFQGDGNPVEIQALQEVLLSLMPGLRVKSWSSKPCVLAYTAHGYPYIDQLAEGVFVCTGGCGSAAKSSDEIGRIGALLAQHGAWHYDLPAERFRVITAK
jgi:sarcosine oxidase